MFLKTRDWIVIFICFLLFISCFKEKENPETKRGYVLEIEIENRNGLNTFLHDSKNKILDSAKIENNKVKFKGVIDFPKRYFVTIESILGGKMFVIENDSISISINSTNISESIISGGTLQKELESFQQESQIIISKIEYLFPDLQRARLNNDAEKLQSIYDQISTIENENLNFIFNYAEQNSESFISAMILNDLTKRDSIDNNKVSKLYQKLSANVKQGPDAKAVQLYLDLH